MNLKIPFVGEIPFEKKVCEITSISLEHEIHVEDGSLKGNFIVTGDYKSHEVSVNKEPFSYILPFEIELLKNVDPDSVEFMIEDFNYEIIDQNKLKVMIDFNVIGSVKEEIEEVAEPVVDQENIAREVEEYFNDKENIEEEEKTEEEVIQNERNLDDVKISEETIISQLPKDQDEYATYHIHMVNDGESIETICTMYHSNINILNDYNDLSHLASGDKIIIPEINE